MLFLLVPIFGVGCFVWAMADWWPMQGHWLPENINAHGGVIDNLFMFILVLTGVIFIATAWRCSGSCGNTTRRRTRSR